MTKFYRVRQPSQEKKAAQDRAAPLIVSFLLHLALLTVFAFIVIMPAVRDTPEIVATYVAGTERISPPLKKRETARQIQRRRATAASAQLARMVQASVASPVSLPPPDAVPPDLPSGLGQPSQKAVGPGAFTGAGRGGMFGSTAQMRGAFEGTIYFFEFIDRMRDGTRWFPPQHAKGRKSGKGKLYTYSFNIPGRDFREGFAGISQQFEWFAIDYRTTVDWPESLAGSYEFEIQVDDGAIFQIDGKDVIDYDGPHGWDHAPPTYGRWYIGPGRHSFRLVYYQGPRYFVGLVLKYRKLGEPHWRIFDLKEILRAGTKKPEHPLT